MRIGCLEILSDGFIQFYSEKERKVIDQLMGDPILSYVKAILTSTKQQRFARMPETGWRI
jgi:Na+/phosphate symporter